MVALDFGEPAFLLTFVGQCLVSLFDEGVRRWVGWVVAAGTDFFDEPTGWVFDVGSVFETSEGVLDELLIVFADEADGNSPVDAGLVESAGELALFRLDFVRTPRCGTFDDLRFHKVWFWFPFLFETRNFRFKL